jgi:excisionase family DNA binding protein
MHNLTPFGQECNRNLRKLLTKPCAYVKVWCMTQDLLSTRQAADLLGTHVSTISRWVAAGKLTPALKLDGGTGPMWFARADLDALKAKAAR